MKRIPVTDLPIRTIRIVKDIANTSISKNLIVQDTNTANFFVVENTIDNWKFLVLVHKCPVAWERSGKIVHTIPSDENSLYTDFLNTGDLKTFLQRFAMIEKHLPKE
jgi:hypothetical protein